MVGFLYVLDHQGAVRKNWPKQMGEIAATAVVADINSDGLMEIVACDVRGSIAAFTPSGEEVWERHVKSAIWNVRGWGKNRITLEEGDLHNSV